MALSATSSAIACDSLVLIRDSASSFGNIISSRRPSNKCSPKRAFKPRVRRRASCNLSSVRIPASYPSFIHCKSSSGALKNRKRSQPASTAVGNMRRRGIEAVIATMCEASVTITPLFLSHWI